MNDDDQKNGQIPPSFQAVTRPKESEPIGGSDVSSVYHSETEVKVSEELKEIGAERVSEHPEITEEHKRAGITETIPQKANLQPTGIVIPNPKEAEVLAKGPSSSGITWFANLVLKIQKWMAANKK